MTSLHSLLKLALAKEKALTDAKNAQKSFTKENAELMHVIELINKRAYSIPSYDFKNSVDSGLVQFCRTRLPLGHMWNMSEYDTCVGIYTDGCNLNKSVCETIEQEIEDFIY
eukprot:Lithocolla_globosa_v1_NODE_742_length_3354_cov_78.839042.p2 type:complete len:112 gc:universal NODE_742_length_3354_cov_78.839042:2441-2106(-)